MALDQKKIALIKSNLSIQIDKLYPLNGDGTFRQDPETKDKAIRAINAWLESYCMNHNILPAVRFETLVTTYPAAFPTRGEKDYHGNAYRGVSRLNVLKEHVESQPAASAHIVSEQARPQAPSVRPIAVASSSQQPSINPATMSVLSPEDTEAREREGWRLIPQAVKNQRIQAFFEGNIETYWPALNAANTRDEIEETFSAVQAIEKINMELSDRANFPERYDFDSFFPSWYDFRHLCQDFTATMNKGKGRFDRLKKFIDSQPIEKAVSDSAFLQTLEQQPPSEKLTQAEFELLTRVFSILQYYPNVTLACAMDVIIGQSPHAGGDLRNALRKVGIELSLARPENYNKTAAQLLQSRQTRPSARPPLASPAPRPSTSASSYTPTSLHKSKQDPRLTSLIEARDVALEKGTREEVITLNRAIAIEKAIIALHQAGAKEIRHIGERTTPSDDHALRVMLHMRNNTKSSLVDAIKATETTNVSRVSEEGIRYSLERNLSYYDPKDQSGEVYKALCAQDVTRADIANVAPAASIVITPAQAEASTSSRTSLVPSSSHTPNTAPVIDKSKFTFKDGGPSLAGSGFGDRSAAGIQPERKPTWDESMSAKYRDLKDQKQDRTGPAPSIGLNKK